MIEKYDAVIISEKETLARLTITPDRIQAQDKSLKEISKIEWKHHFREEDDIDMDNIYTAGFLDLMADHLLAIY